MTRLSWSDTSKRSLETGLDRGVLYPKGTPPAASIFAKNLILNPRAHDTVPYISKNLAKNPRMADAAARLAFVLSSNIGSITAVLDSGKWWVNVPSGTAWTYMTAQGIVGGFYAASMRVKGAAGTTFSVQSTDNVSGAWATNGGYTIPASGEMVVKIPSNLAAAGVNLNFGVAFPSATVKVTEFYVEEVYATGKYPMYDFFDGASADSIWTYSWSGTPNQSTSSRAGSAEIAKNHVLNPRFAALTNWTSTWGAPTVATENGWATLTATAPAAPGQFVLIEALDANRSQVRPGGTVSSSIEVKGVAGRTMRLHIYLSQNAVDLGTIYTDVLLDGTWQKISVAGTNTYTPPATPYMLLRAVDPVVGDVLKVRKPILSKAAAVPDYFDGSMATENGKTFGWLGTVDGSASISSSPAIDLWGMMNGTRATQGPLQSDGSRPIDARAGQSGSGIYTIADPAYVPAAGQYYSARVVAQRIPGETSTGGGFNLSAWDGHQYIAQSVFIPYSSLPADGSPITIECPATVATDGTSTGPYLFVYMNPGVSIRLTKLQYDRVSNIGDTLSYAYFDGAFDDGVIQPMHTYAWHGTAERSYSTMQINNSLAVPWIGLTGVDENGAESAAAYYVDGRPFLFLPKPKEYQATLRAFTYPDEFAQIIGIKEATAGMFLDSQQGDAFDLCYRTLVADNLNGTDAGYKIHLVYNATVAPQGLSYASLGGSINPTDLAWEIQAVPMAVPGYRATAHVIIDTRHMDPAQLAEIEALLYGSDTKVPGLPAPQEIFDLLSFGDTIVITDNGDGTWDAVGSYHNIYLIGDGVFEIDNVIAVDHGDGTYDISSTP